MKGLPGLKENFDSSRRAFAKAYVRRWEELCKLAKCHPLDKPQKVFDSIKEQEKPEGSEK